MIFWIKIIKSFKNHFKWNRGIAQFQLVTIEGSTKKVNSIKMEGKNELNRNRVKLFICLKYDDNLVIRKNDII